MPSVFTRIIANELPAYRIFENDRIIAFLALDQVQPGHTLVVPKIEVDHWFEVPESDFLEVQRVAQKIARSIQQSTQCRRVLTAFVGFEVNHCHLHLIPAWEMSDLNFSKGRKLPPGEMEKLQKQIRAGLNESSP